MTRSALATLALTVLLGGLGSAVAPATARAQLSDDEQARRHFQAGESYFSQSRYDDAAREFMEAYRLSQRPQMLLNASRAYERALEFDRAIEMAERYLTEVPDAENGNSVRERIAALEALRERAQGGEEPEGGEETLPPPREDPQREESAEPTYDDATESSSDDGGGGLGTLGIVGLIGIGAGVVAGGVSLGTGLAAHSTYTDVQDNCGVPCTDPSRSGDIDSGESLATVSTVFTFVGLGLGVVGAALLIVDLTSGGDDPEAPSVGLGPGPGNAGLSLRGSF